jgi:thiol-disulfide isomerase/thioredoxin
MIGVRLTCMAMALAVLTPGSSAAALDFRVDEAAINRLEFPVPESRRERAYLGLSGNDMFRLNRIKGYILVVEIFNMYCPVCQGEAPKVNELYALIAKDPALKGKVKMLGIGVGNTPFEVNVFRKKFEILFPLLSDADFAVEKISKQRIRTPTFLILGLDAGKKVNVIGVHVGRIPSAVEFARALHRPLAQ